MSFNRLASFTEQEQESLMWIQARLSGLFCPRLVMYAIESGAMRSCLNCNHFKDELCTFGNYNQKPPAKIILFGCNNHSSEIPF